MFYLNCHPKWIVECFAPIDGAFWRSDKQCKNILKTGREYDLPQNMALHRKMDCFPKCQLFSKFLWALSLWLPSVFFSERQSLIENHVHFGPPKSIPSHLYYMVFVELKANWPLVFANRSLTLNELWTLANHFWHFIDDSIWLLGEHGNHQQILHWCILCPVGE